MRSLEIGDLGQCPRTWHLRPFRASDQAATRALILGGLGEHFGFIDESLNPDLDDIMASYLAGGHTFSVAVDGTEIVGAGALRCEPSGCGRMVRVSVAPAYRRIGLGRVLVEHLVGSAGAMGLRQILVETNLDWYPAIRLYQRCGFTIYDTDTESVYLTLGTE